MRKPWPLLHVCVNACLRDTKPICRVPSTGWSSQPLTLVPPWCPPQVLPSKQLKARTFRVGAGNTLLLGGLARLDIVDAPSSTLYITVFVSHNINLHMGKTEVSAAEEGGWHSGRPSCACQELSKGEGMLSAAQGLVAAMLHL